MLTPSKVLPLVDSGEDSKQAKACLHCSAYVDLGCVGKKFLMLVIKYTCLVRFHLINKNKNMKLFCYYNINIIHKH